MTSADTVVKNLESDLVTLLVTKTMAGLIADVWSGFGGALINPVVGWAIGCVLKIVMKYGDGMAFSLAAGWEATNEAANYTAAVEAREKLSTGATSDELAKAEADQIAAANRLFNLGTA